MQQIVLEGLPGGGKTTLSKYLTKKLPDSFALPEHVFPMHVMTRMSLDHPGREDAFRLHWTVKDRLVQLYSYKSHIILDRYYITNLAYNYALSTQHDATDSYDNTLLWIEESLAAGRLHIPDDCIVLQVDPLDCNKRKNRQEMADMLWSQLPALHATEYFYQTILPTLPHLYGRLHYIDASATLEEVQERIGHVVI